VYGIWWYTNHNKQLLQRQQTLKMMISSRSVRLSVKTSQLCSQRAAFNNNIGMTCTHFVQQSAGTSSYSYTTTALRCDTESTTTTATTMVGGGGIGLHNVRDRVMVSARPDGPFTTTSHARACTVIGAPTTHGQPYVGTDTSPNNLRQIGLIEKLQQLGWNVHDAGNLPFDEYFANARKEPDFETKRLHALKNFQGNAKNMHEIGIGTHHLAQQVASTLRDAKKFPLIIGGDHSIGIGSLAGILDVHPDVGVLWIDAHADINTPYISESGNMHGMPVGFLMDPIMERTYQQYTNTNSRAAMTSNIPGFEWLQNDFKNRLTPKQLVYVGLRDVDIEERKLITSLGIQAYTMTDIDRTFMLK
jgi:arginase